MENEFEVPTRYIRPTLWIVQIISSNRYKLDNERLKKFITDRLPTYPTNTVFSLINIASELCQD